ncbi:zf-HC2 domain-containing protein [Kitasatospora sp. NPDC127111]|uniref:zf-HC2 domain-containing protein n=1 Tax=Kitasatospora sp. NPDC127111 TaxID=3345363 RepID=UPI00363C9D64
MRCVQFRTALSARLDGEPTGVPDRRLDKHVARCAVCREWLERAERLRGVLPAAGAAGPAEDWTARLLTHLGIGGLGGGGLGGADDAAGAGPGAGDGDVDGAGDAAGAGGPGGAGDADGAGDGGGFGAAGRSGQGNSGPVE